MPGIVLVDVVGQELFSGASVLSRRPRRLNLALVVDDDDCEELDDDDLCPETQRSSVFARTSGERPIEVAVVW
jgi:hypothetical protein